MCLYPSLVLNPKYKPNKKNGGKIPPVLDKRVLYVPIQCGNCMECKKRKSRDWQVRLQEDIKHNTNAKFITFTFNDESINKLIKQCKLEDIHGYALDNAIATKAVHLWRERYRKKYGKSPRHWLVTELGHNGTENIHLHGIIWTNESLKSVAELWGYGYVWIGKGEAKTNYVNGKTVNYIVKYISKCDEKHPNYEAKTLTSPGIGKKYTENEINTNKNKYTETDTDETYRTESGHKIALPIYWRNKLYTEEEREKLWLNKLDKGYRYIGGLKIKASDTKEILKALNHYRQENKILGYGTNKIDWDQKKYEEALRELKYEEREQRRRNNTNNNDSNTNNNANTTDT